MKKLFLWGVVFSLLSGQVSALASFVPYTKNSNNSFLNNILSTDICSGEVATTGVPAQFSVMGNAFAGKYSETETLNKVYKCREVLPSGLSTRKNVFTLGKKSENRKRFCRCIGNDDIFTKNLKKGMMKAFLWHYFNSMDETLFQLAFRDFSHVDDSSEEETKFCSPNRLQKLVGEKNSCMSLMHKKGVVRKFDLQGVLKNIAVFEEGETAGEAEVLVKASYKTHYLKMRLGMYGKEIKKMKDSNLFIEKITIIKTKLKKIEEERGKDYLYKKRVYEEVLKSIERVQGNEIDNHFIIKDSKISALLKKETEEGSSLFLDSSKDFFLEKGEDSLDENSYFHKKKTKALCIKLQTALTTNCERIIKNIPSNVENMSDEQISEVFGAILNGSLGQDGEAISKEEFETFKKDYYEEIKDDNQNKVHPDLLDNFFASISCQKDFVFYEEKEFEGKISNDEERKTELSKNIKKNYESYDDFEIGSDGSLISPKKMNYTNSLRYGGGSFNETPNEDVNGGSPLPLDNHSSHANPLEPVANDFSTPALPNNPTDSENKVERDSNKKISDAIDNMYSDINKIKKESQKDKKIKENLEKLDTKTAKESEELEKLNRRLEEFEKQIKKKENELMALTEKLKKSQQVYGGRSSASVKQKNRRVRAPRNYGKVQTISRSTVDPTGVSKVFFPPRKDSEKYSINNSGEYQLEDKSNYKENLLLRGKKIFVEVRNKKSGQGTKVLKLEFESIKGVDYYRVDPNLTNEELVAKFSDYFSDREVSFIRGNEIIVIDFSSGKDSPMIGNKPIEDNEEGPLPQNMKYRLERMYKVAKSKKEGDL